MEKQSNIVTKIGIILSCAFIGFVFGFLTNESYIDTKDRLFSSFAAVIFLFALSAAIAFAYVKFFSGRFIYSFLYTFLIIVGLLTFGSISKNL